MCATTGTPTTFAGTVTSDTCRNCSHVMGAVARPHAVDTPMSWASRRGTGYPSSALTTRGETTKIEATAANESWNPASKTKAGFHASRTNAPTSSACQRSRSRAVIHASEPSPPATAARMTDGRSPTASTYPKSATSATSSAAMRPKPSQSTSHAAPPATAATLRPSTASTW